MIYLLFICKHDERQAYRISIFIKLQYSIKGEISQFTSEFVRRQGKTGYRYSEYCILCTNLSKKYCTFLHIANKCEVVYNNY